ncbi:MAG: DUF421 domain-containing protein [Phycisphaerae bacterium]|nr:DUF421 domain-containing protein [Phycisphaerae bacterium]
MNDLWNLSIPWWNLAIRAIVTFVAVVFLLRIAGKRQVAQLGIGQLVALLLISNAVQNSMNGGDNSLVGGLILAVVLIVLSYLFELITYRSKRLENLIQGRPTLLIHHGKILDDHLRKEFLTVRELRAILRRQGVHNLNEVTEAILESDGYVSIFRKADISEPISDPPHDHESNNTPAGES